MKSANKKPFYFIEAGNPLIEEHRFAIEAAVFSQSRNLAFSVAPEVVDLKDVAGPQEIILALQHYPHHIGKMLGTIHFDFQVNQGMDIFLKDEEWKRKARYIRWFRAMGEMECLPFFVKDKDVRLYMFAGDFLVSKKAPVQKEETPEGKVRYKITGGAMTVLTKRLVESCKQFMLYCHNTGFEPKECIKSMLADYSLPVHYGDIYKQYQKEIKNKAA